MCNEQCLNRAWEYCGAAGRWDWSAKRASFRGEPFAPDLNFDGIFDGVSASAGLRLKGFVICENVSENRRLAMSRDLSMSMEAAVCVTSIPHPHKHLPHLIHHSLAALDLSVN